MSEPFSMMLEEPESDYIPENDDISFLWGPELEETEQ